jgi:hypothetical protein
MIDREILSTVIRTVPLLLHVSQGEQNVQSDRDRIQDPWNTLPHLYRLNYPATYTSYPLKSSEPRYIEIHSRITQL